jgi:hypothetical protein
MVRAVVLALLYACALAARAASAPYYIESEFQPPRAYVGAEVTLRLRLLRAPYAPYNALRPPQLGDDAELIPPGRLRTYETTRKGVVYDVREHTYVFVPRRAGKLVLPGPELVAPLRDAAGSVRQLRGAPRALEVRPPRAAPGEPWLPARRVTLEESWSREPTALSAGQAVVRTLVVRADGITGNRLPGLRMAAQPGLAVHHDASRFSSEYLEAGMAGRRVQRVVLIAQDEGEIELPALSLAWWDTVADAPRVATLAARTLRVSASAATPQAPPPLPALESPMEILRWFGAVVFILSVAILWAYVHRQPEREARKRLREACQRDNAPRAREALFEWWEGATGGAAAPVLLRMGDAWDERARAALEALDAALYGGHAWDGRAFWQAVAPWLRGRALATRDAARRKSSSSAALPRLFRLQP